MEIAYWKMCIFLPPIISILCGLIEFVLDNPGVPVIVMGDFNTVMDRKLDRFPLGMQTGNIVDDRLSQFLREAGLQDIWRIRNPETQ